MTSGITKMGTNLYKIRVRATCPRTGNRKELKRVQECTLTEARALQYEMRKTLSDDMLAESTPRLRFRDFVASWLAGRKDKIKYSTAKKIVDVWENHVVNTTLADLYVDDIRIEDIENWIESMRAKAYIPGKGKASKRATRSEKSGARAYSAGTLKGYYRVVRQLVTAACARARVRNPCDAVEAPKGGKKKRNVLAIHEVSLVLAYVQEKFATWYPAVLMDVFGGLRWSELSALKWEDVDEEAGVIRVRRSQYKGILSDTTKTGDSEDEPKLVPLLAEVAVELRAHRQRMLSIQHPGLAAGWIFPTEKGGLHRGSPLRDVLDAACAECKTQRRITVHGLRHTANDLLRRVADGEVVRAIIGHTTTEMTHHYSHVDEKEKRTAVTAALELVRGAKGVVPGVASKISEMPLGSPERENPLLPAGSLRGATQI